MALCLAAAPGHAKAAIGDLTLQGCISASEGGGCAVEPDAPLSSASGVAIDPGGDSVYVISLNGDTVAGFARRADGSLAYTNCQSNGSTPQCGDLPGTPLDLPSDVVVSPDGGTVYVSARVSDSVSLFARAASGAVEFDGCDSAALTLPCFDLPGVPIDGASGLAISSDGSSLYVASDDSDSISHFVPAADGDLAFGGCYADTAAGGCDDLNGSPLASARAVAITPDGRFVYVAAHEGSQGVARFARSVGGQLAFGGCLADTAASGCEVLPGEHLSGTRSLAISPDGRFLYVASEFAAKLVQFAIGSLGELSFVSCLVAGAAKDGCDGMPIRGSSGLAISPDGRSLYAVDALSLSITHFRRNPADGRLAFGACLVGFRQLGNEICTDLPGEPLFRPSDVAVSPGGDSVYVADSGADAITIFAREGEPLPPPGQPGPPVGTRPDRPPARCAGRPATIVGTDGADVLRGTPRRDVIAALGGADTIRGRGGADLICGGAGRDAIFGGGGRDRILGEAGVDRCLDGPGRDRVKCERGRGRRG